MDEVLGARSSIPVLWQLSAPALQPEPTAEVCGAPARRVPSAEQLYPPPMVLHDALLYDKELFYDSLFKFHAAFGSVMRIPKIRGKDFNLHGLYCKVIEQGGLQKVIKENKWKTIAEVLDLPPCVTSPSFFLRQNYVTLLHHFEQVHFWGAQGRPVPPPPVPLPQPLEAPPVVPQVEASETPFPKKRGREKFDQVLAGKADPLVALGRNVTGVIDGKFDHGYLVTVVVGSEKLKGVIYHVHPDQVNTKQFAEVDKPWESSDLRGSLQSARRQTKVNKETPPTSTGYKFFATEQKKAGAKGRDIRERWNALTAEEKKPYLDMSDRDKEDCNKDMQEHGEALEAAQQDDDEEGAELSNPDPSSRFKLFQPSSYFSMQSLLDRRSEGFTSFTSQLEQVRGVQHQA